MRTLSSAPRVFVDPTTKKTAFGSYVGCLPRIDLSPEAPALTDSARWLVDRALRRKKWIWLAAVSPEVWVSLAVVRMGYATSAFAFAFDRRAKTMLSDATIVGPPRAAEVADCAHEPGVLATFGFGRASMAIERRPDGSMDVRARLTDFDIDLSLDESSAPPPIAAIVKLGAGMPSATEKRALTRVRGSVTVKERHFAFEDDAVAGYDYTQGLMPRQTKWRWAFGMGRDRSNDPIAFNLVEGFVGEAECAAFTTDAVHPLHEAKFDFDPQNHERPWTLRADGMDLTFDVGAVHEQNTNLVLVRSKFVQPVGLFRGTLRVGDREVYLDGVPGVVEDQDVLW